MPHWHRKGYGLMRAPGGGDILPEPDDVRLTAGRWCVSEAQLFFHGWAKFLVNQCMFMQAMVENSEPLQRVTTLGAMPVSPKRPRRKRVLACFTWNDSRCSTSMPCRFSHTCVRCSGEHARRFCPAIDVPTGNHRVQNWRGWGQTTKLNYVCMWVCSNLVYY